MLPETFQILTFLHRANVRPVQCGSFSCERHLVSKLLPKSQKEMDERFAEISGEQDVAGENRIIFTSERTQKNA